MLQNRQNQVATVQIAARRDLDIALVAAGRAHLPFGSKHRPYGKRLTSKWLPQPVLPVVVVAGPGTADMPSYRSRLSSTASMSCMCRYASERERQTCLVSQNTTTLPIPAPAWAAFAIQRALQG